MPRLGDIASKIRSKNAGPFWITIDIFCGTKDLFSSLEAQLTAQKLSDYLKVPSHTLYRYDIPSLHVLKFSLHRPFVQGSRYDRDMHGAQLAILCSEYELDDVQET